MIKKTMFVFLTPMTMVVKSMKVKFHQNVNFQEIDVECSTGTNDAF